MSQVGSSGGIGPLAPAQWGATQQEWALFAARLKLLPDLLPVVSNPHAVVSPRSNVKTPGKLPSKYLPNGEMVGFSKWTTFSTTTSDLRVWLRVPDYGICVQTRNVRAIDVDVSDPAKADSIRAVIERHCGKLPMRSRSNSSKFLVVFRMEGEFKKRFIGKAADENLVEFLATGQQFVAAGTHPSGVRYQWSPEIDNGIPELTESDFENLWTAISVHHTGEVPLPASASKGKRLEVNSDLTGGTEYPPSHATRVADHCAQIRFFRDTGSEFEPHWRSCAGVLKHTVEGEAVVHEWSAKDPRYSHSETQGKIDGWQTPPATCASFNNYGDLCKKCKFLGKITSPIQLGYEEKSSDVEIDAEQESFVEETDPAQQEVLQLPPGFCMWHNRLAFKKQVDGLPVHVPFCDMLFYLKDRVRNVDGTAMHVIRARVRHDGERWVWRTFEVPSNIMGAGGHEMFKALAAYEIVAFNNQKGYMEEYVKAYMDELRKTRDEINSFRTFGWHKDSIVIGNEVYSKGEAPRKVVLGGTLAPGYLTLFEGGARGPVAAERWVELMEQAYKHPNHEQYQMILAAGFGSMLVNFFEIASGCPINLFGERGTGKSTVAELAMSVWGHPKRMGIAAKVGATNNALQARVAATSSFPYLIDEITAMDAATLGDLYYQLGNAKSKDTLTKDRKRQDPLPEWHCLGFTTSNDSPNDKISSLLADGSAQMSRSLEVQWRKVKTISMHDMADIVAEVNGGLYGAPGRLFAQFLVDNKEAVAAFLSKVRRDMDAATGIDKDYRFWSVQAASIYAGGVLAKKCGLFPFDLAVLRNEVVETIKYNIGNIEDRTMSPLEAFHNMLTSFAQGTIATQTEGDGRSSEMKVDVKVLGEPVARVVRDNGVMYLSTPAIRAWCSKRQIGYNQMRSAVEDAGLMIDHTVKFVLGKGTTLSTGQVWCWKLNWNKIQGIDGVKVVPLKPVDMAKTAP